jgi:hypothetical protein
MHQPLLVPHGAEGINGSAPNQIQRVLRAQGN